MEISKVYKRIVNYTSFWRPNIERKKCLNNCRYEDNRNTLDLDNELQLKTRQSLVNNHTLEDKRNYRHQRIVQQSSSKLCEANPRCQSVIPDIVNILFFRM